MEWALVLERLFLQGRRSYIREGVNDELEGPRLKWRVVIVREDDRLM